MSPREYGQACSLAYALDRVGERWSMLLVRELLLGPLRFSDLARSAGDVPTDILTKRLREMEREGIVQRRELAPPAATTVYELTELGRGLERPIIELGRWGLHFQEVGDVAGVTPTSLPNALRVILQPPVDAELTFGLRSGGHSYRLRVADGWIEAERGEAPDADVTISGEPRDVIAALVAGSQPPDTPPPADSAPSGGAGEGYEVEVEGDHEALEALRAMIVLPAQLHVEALAAVSPAGRSERAPA